MAAHRLRRRERHFASTCTGPLLGTARRVYSGRRRDRTRLTRMRRARPRVIGTAECIDPLPKHRRRTAFPGFPLIDDGLSRGAHQGRELRLTQAEAPAHGLGCVASARARARIFGGVARRPASHVRYDSRDTPSMAANAACDWPSAIRHARSVRGSTTSHHAIGAGQCEARSGGRAYFSQPILEGDRSLFSPAPSPLVPRQWAQSANSFGKWHARQDSNLRPSA